MVALLPLQDLLAQAKAKALDPARCGYDLCHAIVSGVREARASRPDLVARFGAYLLQNHASSLSHEVWATYEQVYMALLQHGRVAPGSTNAASADSEDLRKAQQYTATLTKQFPSSQRVRRLEAMLLEAKREYGEAEKEYKAILEEDPHNLQAVKRQIALHRQKGEVKEAVKKLNDYLTTFCSDMEAWVMLHELYLSAQKYKEAAFCIEELVLINPMSYIYHVRAGEITYTKGISQSGGSHDQLLTARKYFAHALELKPGCLRALYGILLVCAAFGSSTKGKGVKVDTAELVAFAQPLLLKAYTPATGPAHPMRGLVIAMLKKLTVAEGTLPASA